MATMSPNAAQVLAEKGAKLRTHAMSIDRTDNNGYVVSHELRDKEGNMPTDGQRSSKRYHMNNAEELKEHVGKHMGPPSPEEEAAEGE